MYVNYSFYMYDIHDGYHILLKAFKFDFFSLFLHLFDYNSILLAGATQKTVSTVWQVAMNGLEVENSAKYVVFMEK